MSKELFNWSSVADGISLEYEGKVPVRLTFPDRESKVSSVNFRLTLSDRSGSWKTLNITLTDEDDPFFFFLQSLNEEEFQQLKISENLQGDFQKFPEYLVFLLSECVLGEADPATLDGRYVCELDTNIKGDQTMYQAPSTPTSLASLNGSVSWGDGRLKFIQTDRYKPNMRLTLNLRPATDKELKEYLASQWISCRMSLKETEVALTSTTDQKMADTMTLQSEVESLKAANQHLTSQKENLIVDSNAKLTEEMANLKATHSDQMIQTVQKMKAELQEQHLKMEEKYTACDEERTKLLQESTRAHSLISRLEASRDDLRIRLSDEIGRREELEAMLKATRAENQSLDSSRHNTEKESAGQATLILGLKQQVADHLATIKRVEDMLEQSNAARVSAESSLADLREMNLGLKEQVVKSSHEIEKGNTVITKLEEEVRSARSKSKLRKQAIQERDSRINQLNVSMETVKSESRQSLRDHETVVRDRTHLETQIVDLKAKLEEAAETLQSNQNVISFLNKEVTEAQLKASAPPITTALQYRPPFPQYNPGFSGVPPTGSPPLPFMPPAHMESNNSGSPVTPHSPPSPTTPATPANHFISSTRTASSSGSPHPSEIIDRPAAVIDPLAPYLKAATSPVLRERSTSKSPPQGATRSPQSSYF